MNDRFLLPKDPYEDLGFLFWQIMKAWQRAKHRLLDEFSLTPSQMEVLSAIYHLQTEQEEEVSQIAISNLTNIDPMTTSAVIKKLENKKLINRKASTLDTRVRIVNLTDEGQDLLIRAIKKVKCSTNHVFDVVDKDILKNEFKILLDVLNKINN